MPRRIPRISNPKLKKCKYCKARTSKNSRCRRLTSCKKGCINFCLQHGESLGGKIIKDNNSKTKCIEPQIPLCHSRIREFPCKKKLTYFWSRKSYKKFLKDKKETRVKKRSNSSIIRSYKRRHSKSPLQKTRSRRINFI